MMTNLFSMFDPSMGLFSVSWVVCLLVLFFLPSFYWFFNIIMVLFLNYLVSMKMEVDYTLSSGMKGLYTHMGSIFLMVSFYNFFALFPFVFSTTSHLLVTFPLSYSVWLGILIFCWVKSLKGFLAHLIPSGTPIFLMSFMVLVELLSNFIRPIALTFRLTANMMAGHLLMGLIGSFLISFPFFITFLGSFLQSFLVFMELGVSIIQSYVFSTLLLLYLSDSDS